MLKIIEVFSTVDLIHYQASKKNPQANKQANKLIILETNVRILLQ
jgi:hypothetical protein